MKLAEVLGFYAQSLIRASREEFETVLNSMERLIKDLKKVRFHYRKNQMLMFPCSGWGMTALPRVLWGRGDQVIVKVRELEGLMTEAKGGDEDKLAEVHSKSAEVSREVMDLVFGENRYSIRLLGPYSRRARGPLCMR